MTHSCPDCGIEHGDPEPVVIEDNSDKAAEATGEAAVEIARIAADRDVQVAKIDRSAIDEERAAEVAALRARVEVLETAAMPPAEPEVVPVVVPDPEPAPAAPAEPAAAPPIAEPEQPQKKPAGYWG